MNKTLRRQHAWPLFCTLILLPQMADAHTGSTFSSFYSGWAHPFSGIDHIFAMLAVGLWAAQLNGHARWLMPLTFLSVMALGSALGMTQFVLPFIESGIALSLLILGVFIAAAGRTSLIVSCALVALFALYHGYAHGAEMPRNGASLNYALGFLSASAVLHALGISAATLSQYFHRDGFIRIGGGLIATGGAYVWLTA